MKRPREQLESLHPRILSLEERERTWHAIQSRIAQLPLPEPMRISSLKFAPMPFMPVLLALAILIGGSAATAVAADRSIPGDALFPIDRAVENIRLSLALSADAKAKLQVKFAEERFDEAEEAVMRARVKLSASAEGNASAPTSTPVRLDDDSVRGAERAQFALETAIDTLTDVRAKLEAKGETEAVAKISTIIERLEGLAEQHLDVLERVEVRIEGDEDIRLKFRSMGDQLKLDIRMLGGLFVRSTSTDDDEDEDDEDEFELEIEEEVRATTTSDDDRTDDDDSDDVTIGVDTNVNIGTAVILSIKADVDEDRPTEVKIKYLGGEVETIVASKTRAGIVSELATKLGRLAAEIDAVLQVE